MTEDQGRSMEKFIEQKQVGITWENSKKSSKRTMPGF